MLDEALYSTRLDAVPALVVAAYLLLNGSLYVLNLFWFHKMVTGALKLLTGRSGGRSAMAKPEPKTA
jgi:hypothetical protein